MSAPSRDDQKKKSEQRVKEITAWIEKNPNCLIKGRKHHAFYQGVWDEFDVYELPRYLLRLNPHNWRFRAEFQPVKEERQKLGKPIELDPDREEDVKAIRDLLMGIKPKNQQRKDRYNSLKKDFITNSKNGGNGQDTPGIILWDGIYVNGNRRDTILEDLTAKPPEGCQPTQFQKILVSRLPENTTATDIKANETREQIGQDSRERYDYTNSALMIEDYVQQLTKVEKLPVKSAYKQIANQVFGLDEEQIEEYIDFKQMADEFLKEIDHPGQYSYIQNTAEEQKEKGGIVQILKEMKGHKEKIIKMALGGTKTNKLLKASYAVAWYSKQKPKTLDNKTGKMKPMKEYNHRAWRNFISSCFDSTTSTDKLLESGTVDKIDWKDPQKHAVAFAGDIERAKNITETIKANFQPLVYLEKAESQLSKVNSDLNGPRKHLVTAEILKQDGFQTIENIQRYITEISKKVSKSGRKR
jgi:hypothetical protein